MSTIIDIHPHIITDGLACAIRSARLGGRRSDWCAAIL